MIPQKVLDILASTYAYYYVDREGCPSTEDAIKAANAILGIIDISYNKLLNSLICEDRISSCKKKETKWGPEWTVKIVPYKDLNSFDVECMEDALNSPKYRAVASQLNPLFDCIGWNLSYNEEENTYHLKFIGSPTWDIDYDQQDWTPTETYEWKSSTPTTWTSNNTGVI